MVFCDWLSCYQEHIEGGLPVINNGNVAQFEANAITRVIDMQTGEVKMAFDATKIEWTTEKHFEYEGSYSTKIRVKCDGYRVSFDGNIGRLGRTDNVFGYSVVECIMKANDVLTALGLPPFTHKHDTPIAHDKYIASGCIITRIDLTKNYVTGSKAKALRLINYFAGQDKGRRATSKQYGENGVSWGEGSKYWYEKLYLKSDSLGDFINEEIKNWVTENGILRHEISLKSRYLTQHGLRKIINWLPRYQTEYFEGFNMEQEIYSKFTDILTRGTATRTPLEDIPKNLGRIARDWRSGIDVWHDDNYSERTRRGWRKALLEYGIDIKKTSNVTRLPIRVEVIEMQAAQIPHWYWESALAA
jgi:hypothetical protein